MNDISPARKLSTEAVSPAKFAHFVLRTGQIDKMVEWYRTLLNARIVFRDERLCFLSYDDEHHRLALINLPGAGVRDPGSTGTDQSPTATTIWANCSRPTAGSRLPASCRIGRSTMA